MKISRISWHYRLISWYLRLWHLDEVPQEITFCQYTLLAMAMFTSPIWVLAIVGLLSLLVIGMFTSPFWASWPNNFSIATGFFVKWPDGTIHDNNCQLIWIFVALGESAVVFCLVYVAIGKLCLHIGRSQMWQIIHAFYKRYFCPNCTIVD